MTHNVNLLIKPACGLFFFLSMVCFSYIAVSEDQSLDTLFLQGQEQYDNSKYEGALEIFVQLINQAPSISTYHHWSGKCYGKLAEQANWLTAISLAKKTRKAFEMAVELDNRNILALLDLKTFYLEAPNFLGGSKKKASEIQKHLDTL